MRANANILIVSYLSSFALGLWGVFALPWAVSLASGMGQRAFWPAAPCLAVFFAASALAFSWIAHRLSLCAGLCAYKGWAGYLKRFLPFACLLAAACVATGMLAGLIAMGLGPALEWAYGAYVARLAVGLVSAILSVTVAPIAIALYMGLACSAAPFAVAVKDSFGNIGNVYLRLLLLGAVMYALGFAVYYACSAAAAGMAGGLAMVAIYAALGSAGVYAIQRIFFSYSLFGAMGDDEERAA